MKTIDLTPTWAGLLPWMLTVLETEKSEEAKKPIRAELMKLAVAMDSINQINKSNKQSNEKNYSIGNESSS